MNCQFLALLNPHVDKGGFSLYFQYKRAGSLPPGGIITSEDLIPEMIVTHDGSQFSATIRDQAVPGALSPAGCPRFTVFSHHPRSGGGNGGNHLSQRISWWPQEYNPSTIR